MKITFSQLKKFICEDAYDDITARYKRDDRERREKVKQAKQNGEFYALSIDNGSLKEHAKFVCSAPTIEEIESKMVKLYRDIKEGKGMIIVYDPNGKVWDEYDYESLDGRGRVLSKDIRDIFDEYDRLKENIKKAYQKHPMGYSPKMWEIKRKLIKLGIYPGGIWTEDGPTGEDYKFYPQAQEKYDSDSRFKAKVDDLIQQYEEASKEYEDEVLKDVKPAATKFMKFHNEHWRKIAKAKGGFFWPKKDIKSINEISINLA
jgi:hypothetical protein